ncbi:hypothetical protein [Cyanobium gracile]|uniref:Uncharacterized protein n=1 Tax=Cyanobium gracile (strain ATCC 27147 / PCC 6307) TaxID=292564 RepID=K9P9J2_CYAGP|nr:hypothetical protein [Cyanobium gracile]AFY29638.1 hypothetical protein Cyagr_2534 [Cyanobium gracile PCC 6307]
MPLSDAVGGLVPRKHLAGLLAGFLAGTGLAFAGCRATPKEVAIQDAKPGDLLVEVDGSRVELVRAFTPGIANGLHKGVVKVTSGAGDGKGQLYETTAICSVKGEPGWQSYDNIYGDPISDLNAKVTFPVKNRWQFLFHFDGRTDQVGKLDPSVWVVRLKDNLCRKGDFDDT